MLFKSIQQMLDITRDVAWCFLYIRGRQTEWHKSDTGIGVCACTHVHMCTRVWVWTGGGDGEAEYLGGPPDVPP